MHQVIDLAGRALSPVMPTAKAIALSKRLAAQGVDNKLRRVA